MAGASILTLPGDFDPGKNYLVRGKTLIDWREALVKDRVIAGPNLREMQTDLGRIFSAQAGESGRCPYLLPVLAGDKLTISAGLLDGFGEVEALDQSVSASGEAWLTIDATLTKRGTELGGFFPVEVRITQASLSAGGSTPSPSPFALDMSSAGTENGSFVYQVATWSDGVLTSSGAGNIAVAWCWGIPTFARYC